MPPRHAYWTILVDEQPTAFRAALQEDLQPTFRRLKEKHASARLVWFQNGKVWNSRLDAQEAMYARGEMGRRGDARQGGGFRDRNRESKGERGRANDFRQREVLSERRPSHRDGRRESKGESKGKLEWQPKEPGSSPSPRAQAPSPKTQAPRPEEGRAERLRPDWKPKQQGLAPRDHLLRRSVVRDAPPAWKSKPGRGPKSFDRGAKSDRKPRAPRGDTKLEWKPKGAAGDAPKRKWVPKEEYKKSQGIEARRDKNWRPGGAHKDPRQKYKDAKKAKWSRFKQNIRKNWERKQDGAPKKKRRDEE